MSTGRPSRAERVKSLMTDLLQGVKAVQSTSGTQVPAHKEAVLRNIDAIVIGAPDKLNEEQVDALADEIKDELKRLKG